MYYNEDTIVYLNGEFVKEVAFSGKKRKYCDELPAI